MKEISFSIPVSGVVQIDEGSITITVNKAETTITFEPPLQKEGRILLEKGKTMFDIVLDTAREFVRSNDENRFSAATLYHEAIDKYPNLKRNSWTSHVIACAPNHTSHKHYSSRRDYLRYLGDGTYSLNAKYMEMDKLKDLDRQ